MPASPLLYPQLLLTKQLLSLTVRLMLDAPLRRELAVLLARTRREINVKTMARLVSAPLLTPPVVRFLCFPRPLRHGITEDVPLGDAALTCI